MFQWCSNQPLARTRKTNNLIVPQTYKWDNVCCKQFDSSIWVDNWLCIRILSENKKTNWKNKTINKNVMMIITSHHTHTEQTPKQQHNSFKREKEISVDGTRLNRDYGKPKTEQRCAFFSSSFLLLLFSCGWIHLDVCLHFYGFWLS